MKTWDPTDIKELRENLGLIQKEFGMCLGVTGNYVHLIEKGAKKPSKMLCLLLDCIEEASNRPKKKGVK